MNKKFIISTLSVFALALAFTAAASTAEDMGTMTIKKGVPAQYIMALQKNLNVCANANPVLVADGKYGPKTTDAVRKFQISNGGLTADGLAGPKTKAALVAKCSGTSSDNSSSNSSSNSSMSGGETSITNVKVNNADDTSITESAKKAEVAQIKFDVKDADAKLVRADLVFDGTGNDEPKPWKAFSKVYLMDDNGHTIASMDSSSKSDWDETSTSNVYRIRFTDLSQVYKIGNGQILHVAADVNSGVVNTGDTDNWTVKIDNDNGSDGLRMTDGAGVDTFVQAGSDTAGFSISESGAISQFTVTKATTSPAAGTLQVSQTSSSTKTIAIFKAKADANGKDVRLTDFPVALTIGSTGTGDNLDEVVDDVYVTVNGTTYTTNTAVGTGSSQTFHFTDMDNGNVVIKAGTSSNVEVKVKFRSQGNSASVYANGTTIYAAAAVVAADVEDVDSEDNLSSGNVSGSSTAETQALYSKGIQVSNFVSTLTTGDNTSAQTIKGTYDISFKVTAFGNTYYIPKTLVRGTTSATQGLAYTIEDGSGATTTTAGASASNLTSSADTVSNYFEVPEGESITLHASIVVTKGGDGVDFYRVQLNQVGYDLDQSGAVTQFNLSPAQDYETQQVSIEA